MPTGEPPTTSTALLDELGVTGPIVVGAHSFGCLVALALAEQRPDLVAGVVAFCPPLYPDEATARERIAGLGWLERQLASDGPWAEITCRWVCKHRDAADAVSVITRAAEVLGRLRAAGDPKPGSVAGTDDDRPRPDHDGGHEL